MWKYKCYMEKDKKKVLLLYQPEGLWIKQPISQLAK